MKVKLVCVSLYPEDIESLEQKVRALRALGYDMNKSKLVRLAIEQLETTGDTMNKSGRHNGV